MTRERSTPNCSQHTPGPWRVEVGKDNLNSITDEPIYGGIYGAPSKDDSAGWAIARVWSDYVNAEADARLIAAAPDLLAIVEEILGLKPGDLIQDEDIARAREAVKKARGA